jgi:hypothetical protein
MLKALGFRCPRGVTLEQVMPVEVRQLPLPATYYSYSQLSVLQGLGGSNPTINTYPTASYQVRLSKRNHPFKPLTKAQPKRMYK